MQLIAGWRIGATSSGPITAMLPPKSAGRRISCFWIPPYGRGLLTDALQMVAETGLLCEGGIAVAEHAIDEKMPESFGRLTLIKK